MPKCGTVTLNVDGKEIMNGKIDKVPPARYSHTEIFDMDIDLGSIISPFYYDKTSFALEMQIEKCKML